MTCAKSPQEAHLTSSHIPNNGHSQAGRGVVASEKGLQLAPAQSSHVLWEANDGASVAVGKGSIAEGLDVSAHGSVVHARATLLCHHLLLAVQLPEDRSLHCRDGGGGHV